MDKDLVLTAIAKGIPIASKAIGIVRAINTSPLNEQIRNAGQKEYQAMTVIGYSVARALLARILHRDPQDPEVESFLDGAGEQPGFAARVNRLFLEGMKSTSERRRRFLCSVLFGLSFTKIPEDELDRVDLAVERMLPGDAVLLMKIADIQEIAANPDSQFLSGVAYGEERPTKCEAYAVQSPNDLRIVSSNDHRSDADLEAFTSDSRFSSSRTELSSLESLSCVSRSESRASNGRYNFYTLHVTPLGEVVLRALREVRAGFERPEKEPPAGQDVSEVAEPSRP